MPPMTTIQSAPDAVAIGDLLQATTAPEFAPSAKKVSGKGPRATRKARKAPKAPKAPTGKP